MIPFGDYIPDASPLQGIGARVAHNVLPLTLGGYAPLPTLKPGNSTALVDRARGAISVVTSGGVSVDYVGTLTKLYRRQGIAHTDKTGPAFSIAVPARWEFAQFGTEVYGAAKGVRVQWADLEADTAFQNHPNDIQGETVAAISDFLVLGATTEPPGGRVPYRVRWSAINNPQDFTIDPTGTQAGQQDLASDWGEVRRITPGDAYGLVLQARCIQRMDYEGPPIIWRFSETFKNTGPVSGSAVAVFGDTTFYLADNGFHRIVGGAQLQPIGEGKVDRTVLGELDFGRAGEITCTVIPRGQFVVWAYPTRATPAGSVDTFAIYNFVADRWSTGGEAVEILYETASSGLLIDNMTAATGWPGVTDDYPDVITDASQYAGGQSLLGAYRPDHRFADFSGQPGTATLETAEFYASSGRRTFITEIRPIVDGAACRAALGFRQRQSEAVAYTADSPQKASGRCTFRKSARFFRARVKIDGAFDEALGIEDVKGVAGEWR